MLQATTIKFLKDLNKNNNKIWFDENRNKYDAAKLDFYLFVDKLIEGVSTFDSSIQHLKAKDCAFRINRDVRFSKDKSPYKNNMGASISKGGKKISSAGYYFHLQPNQSFSAGGFYAPIPPELAKLRQEIDYNFRDWQKIITNSNFKKHFVKGVISPESLSRPPKGYDENNPAINFLKMKGFLVTKPFTDDELQSKFIIKEILKSFKAIKPMLDFLNLPFE